MYRDLAPKISDSELEVMRVLWRAGDALPVTEIRETLQRSRGHPEHFAFGIFRIQPDERKVGERGIDIGATTADLAQQSTMWGEMIACLLDDSPHDIETIDAAIKRHARLSQAFIRQIGHTLRVHIRRISDDQIIAVTTERLEEIASVECQPFVEPVVDDIAHRNCERSGRKITASTYQWCLGLGQGQGTTFMLFLLTLLPVKRNGRGVLASGNSCSRRGSRSSRSPWQELIVSRSTRSPSRE